MCKFVLEGQVYIYRQRRYHTSMCRVVLEHSIVDICTYLLHASPYLVFEIVILTVYSFHIRIHNYTLHTLRELEGESVASNKQYSY